MPAQAPKAIPTTPPESPHLHAGASHGAFNPGSRSFLADFLLPDTTSVAQDVYQSWIGSAAPSTPAPYGSATEFHDADSLLGSFSSGFQSFVSASAASVAQGASFLAASAGAFVEGVLHAEGKGVSNSRWCGPVSGCLWPEFTVQKCCIWSS